MNRRGVAAGLASGALVLTGLLAGCGSSEDDYCAALKQQQSIFADDGTGVSLLVHLADLEDVAAKAPDDLTDEWQTALTALQGLRDAIVAAGVEPVDFVDGKPPSSVSGADQRRIAAAASRVSEQGVVEAINGIDQQAKDVCKLQLGL